MTALATGVAFPALGTTAVVITTDPDESDVAVAAVMGEVAAVDRACSRFRPDSELAALNRAGGVAVAASPVLLAALQAAVRAAQLTEGLVDPSVGSVIRVLGYDRDFALVTPTGPPVVVTAAAVPGWRSIEVDRQAGTARVAPGVSLDLGATAKAWAADRAAAAAAAACRSGVLVSLGGDVAVAGTPPTGGWRVRVTDHHAADPGAPGQTVALNSGGLATSGTTARRWRRGGRHVHHIVDPTTGFSASGPWRTVSVAADTCVDANTASTAAIILGERAREWLEARRLPARLVSTNDEVVRTGGWPYDDESLPC